MSPRSWSSDLAALALHKDRGRACSRLSPACGELISALAANATVAQRLLGPGLTLVEMGRSASRNSTSECLGGVRHLPL